MPYQISVNLTDANGNPLALDTPLVKAALSFENLTISTTVVPLPTIPASAVAAVITLEGAFEDSIRYTIDGTTPSSSVGHQKYSEDDITLVDRAQLTSFQALRIGTADITARITYY